MFLYIYLLFCCVYFIYKFNYFIIFRFLYNFIVELRCHCVDMLQFWCCVLSILRIYVFAICGLDVFVPFCTSFSFFKCVRFVFDFGICFAMSCVCLFRCSVFSVKLFRSSDVFYVLLSLLILCVLWCPCVFIVFFLYGSRFYCVLGWWVGGRLVVVGRWWGYSGGNGTDELDDARWIRCRL